MTHELLRHEFLTKAEVAQLFRVHANTIDQWVAKGSFPKPVSYGGHPMWCTEVLKKHVQQHHIKNGYTAAQVTDIFGRANLAPPGEHITLRIPSSLVAGSKQLSVAALQDRLASFIADPNPAPLLEAKPGIDYHAHQLRLLPLNNVGTAATIRGQFMKPFKAA